MQVCKYFNYLGFNGLMANARAVSRSCWPELINGVIFLIANATLHRAASGSHQATGSSVYIESDVPD